VFGFHLYLETKSLLFTHVLNFENKNNHYHYHNDNKQASKQASKQTNNNKNKNLCVKMNN